MNDGELLQYMNPEYFKPRPCESCKEPLKTWVEMLKNRHVCCDCAVAEVGHCSIHSKYPVPVVAGNRFTTGLPDARKGISKMKKVNHAARTYGVLGIKYFRDKTTKEYWWDGYSWNDNEAQAGLYSFTEAKALAVSVPKWKPLYECEDYRAYKLVR